jgi:hypothetical protein
VESAVSATSAESVRLGVTLTERGGTLGLSFKAKIRVSNKVSCNILLSITLLTVEIAFSISSPKSIYKLLLQ